VNITSIIDCSNLYNNAAENLKKLDSRTLWLDRPIQTELHNGSGAFNNGIAIILRKLAHSPHKAGQYMICVDLEVEGHTSSIHSELLEALGKYGRSDCIALLSDIVRICIDSTTVHKSYTHSTLTEFMRERRPGLRGEA
jgi:hypothetical protein